MIKHQNTFGEVLKNLDDQVVVRHLLYKHVSKEAKAIIVEEFNKKADERNSQLVESAEISTNESSPQ